jgi:hypothetical protein
VYICGRFHPLIRWRIRSTNQIKMTDEIKRLKKELKEWKSQEVTERFERVNSQLHIVTINELQNKIKRLKRGEDI